MTKTIAIRATSQALTAALAAGLIALAAHSAKAADACKTVPEAGCTAEIGCKWVPAETWTRQSDGKERTTKARCSYDAKAAREVMQSRIGKKAEALTPAEKMVERELASRGLQGVDLAAALGTLAMQTPTDDMLEAVEHYAARRGIVVGGQG